MWGHRGCCRVLWGEWEALGLGISRCMFLRGLSANDFLATVLFLHDAENIKVVGGGEINSPSGYKCTSWRANYSLCNMSE